MAQRSEPAGPASAAATASGRPLRRCIVSGRVRPKDEMVRFVIGPGGDVVPDIDGRLPGRGLWLSAGRDVINTACARNLFARASRGRVAVAADLTDRVERLLARRCLELIGLARRAGEVVAGFEKARAWLSAREAGVLLAASDGASGGRARIRRLAPEVPLLALFSAVELGAALGRGRTVHAVVAPGGLAEMLLRHGWRLAAYRKNACGASLAKR